jgi:hypothetical protein
LFFEAMALFLKAEVTHVAEAAFQHRLWWQGLEPLTDLAMLRIVRCQAPAELTRQRALTRMAAEPTRAAHADTEHFSVQQNSTSSTSTHQPSTSTLPTAGALALRRSPPSAAADERRWWRHIHMGCPSFRSSLAIRQHEFDRIRILVESADNRAGAGMADDDAAPWQQQRLRQILFDGNIAIPSATAKNSLAQSTSRNRRRPAQGCRWYSGVRASR